MANKSYTEPVYLISMVSEILEIHPQTLRQYEREGLISPSRTNGRIRLYSQKDIDNIKTVLNLTRKFGVNLAGVDIILQQNIKIKKLEEKISILNCKLNPKTSIKNDKALIVKKSKYDIVVFKE